MKELKTAACYIRVSTDKQEELSPASQLKEIKRWAKENGYILTNEYVFMENEGISGRSADKRPEFQRMIATAKLKPKPFDAIILWKFSRFARNQEEATFYKGLLRKKLGIDVISISEPVLEGMFGRLIEMIIEWFDEYYSVNLAGEVMRGMTEKAQRGGYQCAPPFGYKPNKDTGIPDIIPEQAQVVRMIFNMISEPATSYFDICQHLNNSGIKTKNGCIWRQRELKYLLENPFYAGKVRWNRRSHTTHTPNEKEQWIIADAPHEAIIDPVQFEKVQEIIQSRAAKISAHSRPASTKHWLSGLVKCSNCGGTLTLADTRNGKRRLRCSNNTKGTCNVPHSIYEHAVLSGLTSSLQDMLDNTLPIKYEIKADKLIVDNSLYENALAKLEQKEKRIKQAYMDGIDSIEEYKENKSIIAAERKRLLDKYHKLIPAEPIHIDEDKIKKDIRNVIDIINSDAEDKIKYEAIHSVVDHVTYIKAEKRLEVHLVQYG